MLKNMSNERSKQFMLLVGLTLFTGMVGAFTAPLAGDLGYDLYNTVVNGLLKGAIGQTVAVGFLVVGAATIQKSWLIALLSVVAASAIFSIDTIVTSFGATLSIL